MRGGKNTFQTHKPTTTRMAAAATAPTPEQLNEKNVFFGEP